MLTKKVADEFKKKRKRFIKNEKRNDVKFKISNFFTLKLLKFKVFIKTNNEQCF